MQDDAYDSALGARLIEFFCHLASSGGGLGRGHRLHSMPRKGRRVHTQGRHVQGLRAMSPGQGSLQPREEEGPHPLNANQGPQAATSWGGGIDEDAGGAREESGGGGRGGGMGGEGVCQGASKTGSVRDVRVPAELRHIYEGSLKGNGSLLNA